jgi:hypothetical protein
VERERGGEESINADYKKHNVSKERKIRNLNIKRKTVLLGTFSLRLH